MIAYHYRHGLVVIIDAKAPNVNTSLRAYKIARTQYEERGIKAAPFVVSVLTLPEDHNITVWTDRTNIDATPKLPDEIVIK